MRVTPKIYADAKKLLNNGNSIKEVVKISGLGDHTVRFISRSKNWQSYRRFVIYNHTTKAQRKLMQHGISRLEAKAMTKQPSTGSKPAKKEIEQLPKYEVVIENPKSSNENKLFLFLKISVVLVTMYFVLKLLQVV